MDAFGPALAAADHIVLADIYAAGEDPLAGITVEALASAIRRSVRAPVEVAASLDDVVTTVLRASQAGRRRDDAWRRFNQHDSRAPDRRAQRAGWRRERRRRVSPVAGSRRQALPPRARQAGAPAAELVELEHPIGSLRCDRGCPSVWRLPGSGGRRAGARAPDRPDHRARQRPDVHRRGPGGAQRVARTESALDRPRHVAPSPVVVAVGPGRGSPTFAALDDRCRGVRASTGWDWPHQGSAVPGRRARRAHRRVRAAVRGARSADHRRPARSPATPARPTPSVSISRRG